MKKKIEKRMESVLSPAVRKSIKRGNLFVSNLVLYLERHCKEGVFSVVVTYKVQPEKESTEKGTYHLIIPERHISASSVNGLITIRILDLTPRAFGG